MLAWDFGPIAVRRSCSGESDMARKDGGCDLTAREVPALFSDSGWAAKFPPILTLDQAAELVQVPKQTLYAWSSQGRLRGCSRRAGKHLRILRDRFIQKLFIEGLYDD
jgi:excisionase family DNA binding protein